MKPMPHEQKRLQQYATLTLRLSPDTRPEVTRKSIADFTKDLLNTVARKRQIRNWFLVLVETDKEDE